MTLLPVLLMLQYWLPGISLISISCGMEENEISRPHTDAGLSEYWTEPSHLCLLTSFSS